MRASYAAGQLTTPKSGKVRAVPLAPDVASAIASLGRRELFVGDDDLVFVGEAGGYLDGSALRRRYKATLIRADLRPLRFHDLRHYVDGGVMRHVRLFWLVTALLGDALVRIILAGWG